MLKTSLAASKPTFRDGTPTRNRTQDRLIWNQVLSQLSYRRKSGGGGDRTHTPLYGTTRFPSEDRRQPSDGSS